MTENLNCKTCGQNVMVSGLKVFNGNWNCRSCIKGAGGDITTTNALLVYDNPTTTVRVQSKTKEMLLKEITT